MDHNREKWFSRASDFRQIINKAIDELDRELRGINRKVVTVDASSGHC